MALVRLPSAGCSFHCGSGPYPASCDLGVMLFNGLCTVRVVGFFAVVFIAILVDFEFI
jgi:hypothetical protein